MKAVFLILLCALAALAADINGKWTGIAEGPNGKLERSFNFKLDGGKLTGETESEYTGKSTLKDGKVDGDNISFIIVANVQGNETTLNYKGKVMGDQIKLTVEIPALGQPIEYTLKRGS